MKKIFYVICYLLLFVCVSCANKDSVKKSSRIKIIELKQSTYVHYEIIEIDGQEYLSSSHGGIIKLEKSK